MGVVLFNQTHAVPILWGRFINSGDALLPKMYCYKTIIPRSKINYAVMKSVV